MKKLSEHTKTRGRQPLIRLRHLPPTGEGLMGAGIEVRSHKKHQYLQQAPQHHPSHLGEGDELASRLRGFQATRDSKIQLGVA
jgi:hypothetical protein